MEEKKFTSHEYALMYGGHSLPEKDEGLSFIQSLGEAKMYKTRNQIKHDGARGITDHLFVSLLSLYTMANDYNYAPVAKEYSKRTTTKGNFNTPSPTGTDLYQTLYTIGKPDGLLDSEADRLLLNKVKISQPRIRQFLKQVEQGTINQGQAQAFFYKLEKDLAIQDPRLRATRRLVQDWTSLSSQQQTLAATEINKYFRRAARRSDLNPLFSKFASESGLIASSGRLAKIGKRVARGAAAFAAGYAAGKMTGM